MFNSLRSKYVALLFGIIVVVSLVLTTFLLLNFKQTSDKTNSANSLEAAFQLYQNAELLVTTLATQLAGNLTNPLYYRDMETIQNLLEVAAGYPEIIEVIVFDDKGKLIHDGTLYIKTFGEEINLSQQQLNEIKQGNSLLNREPNLIRYFQPVFIGDQVIGTLYLSFSLELVNSNVQELQQHSTEYFDTQFNHIVTNAIIILLVGLTLGGVLVWLVIGFLNRPIQHLVNLAQNIAKGDFTQRINLQRDDELGNLSQELNQMADRLEDHDRDIRHLAFNDPLTSLPNRRAFRSSLKKAVAQSKRVRENLAILFVDIDGFKGINDAYGHDAGDQVLVEIAARIKSISREADLLSKGVNGTTTSNQVYVNAEQQPMFARLGGDEFVLLLRNLTNPEDAAIVARRIINSVTKPIVLEKGNLSISCSVGIATFPQDAESELELMRHADIAMYNVKTSGKNNFKFFCHSMIEQEADIEKSELNIEPSTANT